MTTENSIVLHPLSDLSRVRTPYFVYHLKQSFSYVQHAKGKVNYHEFCKGIIEALQRDARHTFIITCLTDLLYIFAPSGEHPTSLFLMVLSGLAALSPTFAHDSEARKLAADLFNDLILSGSFNVNEHVFVNLSRIFEFKIEDLREELQEVTLDSEKFQELKTLILKLIRSHHFCTAASVIKRLGCAWEEFLEPMLDAKQYQLAEEWATSEHTENYMISLLIRCYERRELMSNVRNMAKKYNLSSEFADAIYQYNESEMTKLAKKGRWLQALNIVGNVETKDDGNDNIRSRLFQRLEKLALEIHNVKLFQLCQPVSVEGETEFLKLEDIGISEENEVIMIDTIEGLAQALVHFSEDQVDVIGIDSEWVFGPRRVSILQIATAKKVFIFDMINLFDAEPGALDLCLKAVFHSTSILKLGYGLHHDLKQLSNSYGELECFRYCEAPTLDLQKVFPSVPGGLSGLSKTVLGSALNKSVRLSDWRERPLSNSQLQYAALDAAVLIAIYKKECRELSPSSSGGIKGKEIIETLDWKSQIRSCRINFEELKITKSVQNQNYSFHRNKTQCLAVFSC